MASLLFMPNVNFSQISNLIFGSIVHLEAILTSAHKTTPEHPNQIKVKPCYFQPVFNPSHSPICSHHLKNAHICVLSRFLSLRWASYHPRGAKAEKRKKNGKYGVFWISLTSSNHNLSPNNPFLPHFSPSTGFTYLECKILHSRPTEPFREFLFATTKTALDQSPNFSPAHFSNSFLEAAAKPGSARHRRRGEGIWGVGQNKAGEFLRSETKQKGVSPTVLLPIIYLQRAHISFLKSTETFP